ncbi:MAG: N-acetyltransferase [Myxococcota bacterium]|nr:N-acetyltransferase [Myxococcota bacterium]
MTQPVEIRPEQAGDERPIHDLTEAAFRGMPYADGDEQEVVDRLRSAGALQLSLVAVQEGEVVGHVAFSPAEGGGPGSWLALGPVSVRPDLQRAGIGSALIERGLAEIRKQGALGCILTGNPAYYRRFGFEVTPQHAPANEPSEFFMLRCFGNARPTGAFAFHPAFYGDPSEGSEGSQSSKGGR